MMVLHDRCMMYLICSFGAPTPPKMQGQDTMSLDLMRVQEMVWKRYSNSLKKWHLLVSMLDFWGV